MKTPHVLATLAAIALTCAPLPISACDDHHGACEVEDWRYWHIEAARILGIEGVATCDTGTITIRLYQEADGEPQFLGIADGRIEGHVLTANAVAIHKKPTHMSIKYSIEPGG